MTQLLMTVKHIADHQGMSPENARFYIKTRNDFPSPAKVDKQGTSWAVFYPAEETLKYLAKKPFIKSKTRQRKDKEDFEPSTRPEASSDYVKLGKQFLTMSINQRK